MLSKQIEIVEQSVTVGCGFRGTLNMPFGNKRSEFYQHV